MSDFIYSNIEKSKGELTRYMQSIYHSDAPQVIEYHGEWGSLAVSHNLYNGFQPIENKKHIFVVIGGPVLYFTDNRFLTGNDPVAGTKAIYDRFLKDNVQWDEDLSGPFVILIIDKESRQIICVTDLMMFIPVYKYEKDSHIMMSTHVNALAKTANQLDEIDPVAMTDFVLNGVVTYPHTVYKNLFQIHPASIKYFNYYDHKIEKSKINIYWLPEEKNKFKNINDAAHELRDGLQNYIRRVTEGMNEVAQFISGGEDTRVIAGLLPSHLKRDAFIFLDSMNREGMIANKVSNSYGLNFNVKYRSETHYIDILPEASDLIGSTNQYLHVHSLGLHKICELDKYLAVFGGYLSDSLLKAVYSHKGRGIYNKLPFLPEFYINGETHSNRIESNFVKENILNEIYIRRIKHVDRIRSFRNNSVHEWFALWPASMRLAIPYFYSKRRLFRSYEPFLSNTVVKISASVPTSWKLNRRLFHRFAKPLLKPSKNIPHTKGFFPYYPWYINIIPYSLTWSYRKLLTKAGLVKVNHGSWGDWQRVLKSKSWEKIVDQYSSNINIIDDCFNKPIKIMLDGKELMLTQKLNILQVKYYLNSNNNEEIKTGR